MLPFELFFLSILHKYINIRTFCRLVSDFKVEQWTNEVNRLGVWHVECLYDCSSLKKAHRTGTGGGPPSQDMTPVLKSQAWYVLWNLDSSSLNTCMYMAGGRHSCSCRMHFCRWGDCVTGLQKACGMSILWKYPAYLVHKGYEVSDVVLIENMCNRTQMLLLSSLVTLWVLAKVNLHYAQILLCYWPFFCRLHKLSEYFKQSTWRDR